MTWLLHRCGMHLIPFGYDVEISLGCAMENGLYISHAQRGLAVKGCRGGMAVTPDLTMSAGGHEKINTRFDDETSE